MCVRCIALELLKDLLTYGTAIGYVENFLRPDKPPSEASTVNMVGIGERRIFCDSIYFPKKIHPAISLLDFCFTPRMDLSVSAIHSPGLVKVFINLRYTRRLCRKLSKAG